MTEQAKRDPQPNRSFMLDAALAYAAKGWPVFPCNPGTKERIGGDSKSPFIKGGFTNATTDRNQIIQWWTRRPNALIGIRMGKVSGVFALDEDLQANTKKGFTDDGPATTAKFEAKYGKMPETRMHYTQSGGRHFIFKWVEGIRNIPLHGVASGWEIKGEGGYVIGPPSIMEDGKAYSGEGEPVEAPKALLQMILAYRPETQEGESAEVIYPPEFIRELDEDCQKEAARVAAQGIVDHDFDADTDEDTDLEKWEMALACIRKPDYDTWYRVGAAMHKMLGSVAVQMFEDWSRTNGATWKSKDIRKWDQVADINSINSGTVFRFADEADPTFFPRWEEHREQRREERRQALLQTELKQAKAQADQGGSLFGEWNAGYDIALPPPRGWLLGNMFARQYLSILVAEGGVGKSAVYYLQLLSLALGRSLAGDHVFQRCRVLIMCLEDNAQELRRRIAALRMFYDIKPEELKDWLILYAPKDDAAIKLGKLMTLDRRGRPMPGELAAKLEAMVQHYKLDVIVIDPFIKAHSVSENDNEQIDMVASVLTGLAIKHNVAVALTHHTGKQLAPEPGDANRGRGASALKDAGRLVYTLTTMSIKEAEHFNIPETERTRYVRMDGAKINLIMGRPLKWFYLENQPLANATALYPRGDHIQVAKVWTPPEAWNGVTDEIIERILSDIDKGMEDGNRYNDGPNIKDRAAWKVVRHHVPTHSEEQARDIIKAWISDGTLTRASYTNPKTRKDVEGLVVNKSKLRPVADGDQGLPF